MNSLFYAVRPLVVLRYVGMLCLVLAVLNLAPLSVAVGYREWQQAGGYLLLIVILLLLGVLSRVHASTSLQRNEGLVTVALIYLLQPLLLSLPFHFSGLAWLDAWFEGMSAVTTTGLSTVNAPESMPRSFLFARAWTQWYGGLGIVVFSLALLIGPGLAAKRLVDPALEQEDLVGSTRAHVRRILWVYLSLTAAGLLLLWPFLGGYRAVHYVLSGISTGGFAPDSTSLGQFSYPGVQWLVLLIAFCGAIPLPLYYRGWRRGWRALFQDLEVRGLLLITIFGAAALTLLLGLFGGQGWLYALHHAPLMVLSAQSTTGYYSVDPGAFDHASLLLLVVVMFIGGGMASSAGGVKIMRLLLFLRMIRYYLQHSGQARHAVLTPNLSGRALDQGEVIRSLVLFLLMIGLVLLGWIAFLLHDLPPIASLFEVVSAVATVGLSTGLTGAQLPADLKIVLGLSMLFGRLEIIALLVLLWPGTWLGRRSVER